MQELQVGWAALSQLWEQTGTGQGVREETRPGWGGKARSHTVEGKGSGPQQGPLQGCVRDPSEPARGLSELRPLDS